MRQAEIGVLLKKKMHLSPSQEQVNQCSNIQSARGNKGLAGLKGLRVAGHPFSRTGFYTDIWQLALHFMVKKWTPMIPLVGAQCMERNESCAKFNLSLWQASLTLLKLLNSLMGSLSKRKEINIPTIYPNQIIKHLKMTLKGTMHRLMPISELAAPKGVSSPNC